jgi:hypothetical protein
MRKPVAIAGLIAAVALLFTTAPPSGAVIGGTTDTTGRFPNVGSLQVQIDGQWFDFCSGSLVAPNVVLTAAHCTDFFSNDASDPNVLGPEDWRVSFDADPGAGSTYYHADHFVVDPEWLANTVGPGGGNSKHSFLKPGLEDVALVYLTTNVAGITPAPVADAGYWDGKDLKKASFTVVGYGTDAFITGSAHAPKAIVLDDGARSYRDVSLVTTQDAYPDRFLKISASVCFGDSGGPVFHDGTVVALNTWTFSSRCAANDLEYRLDSAPAQAFLDAHLG